MTIARLILLGIVVVSLTACDFDDWMAGGTGDDKDCSDYSGPVVIHNGYDPNHLDKDHDGIGCEDN